MLHLSYDLNSIFIYEAIGRQFAGRVPQLHRALRENTNGTDMRKKI
jgi:hypothetical protein